MKTGITDQVRAAAEEKSFFSIDDLIRADYDRFISPPQVRNVIRELRKTGEFIRVGPSLYRYEDEYAPDGPKVKRRCYRAMHTKGMFSVREVAILTDADWSYVRRLIRGLVKKGDIEAAGRGRNPRGNTEQAFRVRNRDRFYATYVRQERAKKK